MVVVSLNLDLFELNIFYHSDCCKNFARLTVVGFQTIFKRRPDGARKWILCFVSVFCMAKAIDSGAGSVIYLFYRKQYSVTNTDFANLQSMYTVLMFISQVDNNSNCQ